MDKEERKQHILKELEINLNPISASNLGKKLNVSRQVIVSDVEILRALGYNIKSTARGYILEKSKFPYVGEIKCCHGEKEVKEELNTIVDYGGTCINIRVNHSFYGEIVKELNISSRYDVEIFTKKLNEKDKPLSYLSQGVHYHKIGVESEEIFNIIKNELVKKGIVKIN